VGLAFSKNGISMLVRVDCGRFDARSIEAVPRNIASYASK
jgi:hypothetical protein